MAATRKRLCAAGGCVSCLTLADILAVNAATLFDLQRGAIWGDAELLFEDKDQDEVVTVETGWNGAVITSEATGVPELEINVLPQDGVTKAMLDATCRFVVLKGRRHEKRTYEYRLDAPERHQLRFQAIGEAV